MGAQAGLQTFRLIWGVGGGGAQVESVEGASCRQLTAPRGHTDEDLGFTQAVYARFHCSPPFG